MANWDNYTQKSAPEDADTLMIKDTAGAANKRTPFSGVWNWIVSKLTSAVISQLETTNKSIIPAINELNGNINVDYVNKYKTQSYQPSQYVPFYSETLTGGLFLCVAWAEATASIDASMTLSIQGAIERAITVRGSMLNGGGMIVTTFVDARSVPRQINFQIYSGHTTAVEIRTRANIIKLR